MRRVLVVLTAIALSAPAWGITGKVVDSNGRPVAKAKVGFWTFWTSGRAYHADRNGEFVAYRNIASDGTVYGTNHKVVDADGKRVDYDRKDGVSVEVADGKDKSGVDLSISLPVKR